MAQSLSSQDPPLPERAGILVGRPSAAPRGARNGVVAVFMVAFGVQAASGVALHEILGLPEATKWLDEVAIGVALAALFAKAAITGRQLAFPSAFKWAIVYTIIATVSAIANEVTLLEAFAGWRVVCQGLLFYLMLVWLGRPACVRWFVVGFCTTALAHVLAAAQQYSAVRGSVGFDDITGGFGPGTANLLGHFCGVVAILCFTQASIAGRRRYLLVVVPVAIMWGLASSLGSYLAFIIVMIAGIVMSRELKTRAAGVPILILIGCGIAGLGYFVSTTFDVTLTQYITGPISALLGQQIDDQGNPGRLALAASVWQVVSARWSTLLLGLGTGSVATFLGDGGTPSHLYKMAEHSGAVYVPSSILQFIAETGVLGAGVVIAMFCHLYWIGWRAWRTSAGRDERALLLGFVLLVVFCFVGAFTEVTVSFQPVAYPLWALAAYATPLAHRQRICQAIKVRPVIFGARLSRRPQSVRDRPRPADGRESTDVSVQDLTKLHGRSR